LRHAALQFAEVNCATSFSINAVFSFAATVLYATITFMCLLQQNVFYYTKQA